ncbi:MAG: ATP/GTP-binding protein [Mycobacteriaceae bacterium]
MERVEPGPDGTDWHVRAVAGSRAVKTYRCPGCDHEVVPGTAHVLAWPGDDWGGAQERRHWHTGCWSGRGRRGLTRRWS